MNSLLNSIIEAGKAEGQTQEDIAQKAGIHAVSLSRIVSTGNCRLATAEALARAVGLRIVCVPDNQLAEKLIRGDVF